MEKGKIIVGYQGIGKSTLAGKGSRFIDLESGSFYVDGMRYNGWHKVYVNIAKHLSEQGFVVFVSSHKAVREYMNEKGIEFTVVCPSPELKEQWLGRLRDRYAETGLDKDFRALANAEEKYDENIADLMKEKSVFLIKDMDYRLGDIAVYNCANIRRDVFGFLDNLILNI